MRKNSTFSQNDKFFLENMPIYDPDDNLYNCPLDEDECQKKMKRYENNDFLKNFDIERYYENY